MCPPPEELAVAKRRFEYLRAHLLRIGTAIYDLRQDVLFLARDKERRFVYCVDFLELWRYLSIDARPLAKSVRGKDGTLPVNGDLFASYVTVLLFISTPEPLCLLPGYYEEYIRALYFRARQWSSSARPVTDALQDDVRNRLLTAPMRQLSEIATHINGIVDTWLAGDRADPTALAGLKVNLRASLADLLDAAERGKAELGAQHVLEWWVQRFEGLRRSKRLRPLGQIVGGPLTLRPTDDEAYDLSMAMLESVRARKRANAADAQALATVCLCNEQLAASKMRFALVSSAPSMQVVRQGFQSMGSQRLSASAQIRDLHYWGLWFALARGGGRPSVTAVEEFIGTLSPLLDEANMHSARILAIMRGTRTRRSEVVAEVADSGNGVVERMEALLRQIESPVRASIADLILGKDTLLMASGPTGAVLEVVNKLGTIVEALDTSPALGALEPVVRQIQALVGELSALLSQVRGTSVAIERLVKRDLMWEMVFGLIASADAKQWDECRSADFGASVDCVARTMMARSTEKNGAVRLLLRTLALLWLGREAEAGECLKQATGDWQDVGWAIRTFNEYCVVGSVLLEGGDEPKAEGVWRVWKDVMDLKRLRTEWERMGDSSAGEAYEHALHLNEGEAAARADGVEQWKAAWCKMHLLELRDLRGKADTREDRARLSRWLAAPDRDVWIKAICETLSS